MMRAHHLKSLLVFAVLAAFGALLAVGCGKSSSNAASEKENEQQAQVSLSEWQITGANGTDLTTLKAGETHIVAKNDGKEEHEFVVIKTDTDAAALPKSSDGNVDEEAAGQSPGEIEGIKAGKTKDGTFLLQPGKYVFICNLPGHYALGMHAQVTVQ